MHDHRSVDFLQRCQQQASELSKNKWYHSIELPDGRVMPGHVPLDALRERVRSFPIPEDLRGKRVLDVGCATGWFSFEMERRGAKVVAIDCLELEEFQQARNLLHSQVEYRTLDADEILPEDLGFFDYVLFFGVLYHLRHPLLGLERVCSVTTEAAFVESFVTDDPAQESREIQREPCLLEFYEIDELGGQIDNWFGPNTACLLAMCRSAGFARVTREYRRNRRAGVTCSRRWPNFEAMATEHPSRIRAAVNTRTQNIYFSRWKDEYISVYFASDETDLTRDTVFPEVDGLAARPLTVTQFGRGGWQANIRRPPGLLPGNHSVRLRTSRSGFSNEFAILVSPAAAEESPAAEPGGIPASTAPDQPSPVLFAVENSSSPTNRFFGYKSEYVACYFRTPESGFTKMDITLEVGGHPCPVELLMDIGNQEWQVNARLPAALPAGSHTVRLRTARSGFSNAMEIVLSPPEAAT